MVAVTVIILAWAAGAFLTGRHYWRYNVQIVNNAPKTDLNDLYGYDYDSESNELAEMFLAIVTLFIAVLWLFYWSYRAIRCLVSVARR